MPKVGDPAAEMHPFSESQLEDLWTAGSARNDRLAAILLIAGWTGLRWSELRAVRVRDFVEIPMPLLVVQRAASEGIEVKVTKGGRARRVPLADRVLPLVRGLARERDGDELLLVTESGHRLHASALKRAVAWSTIFGGRRIHDLRHTRRVSGWQRGGRGDGSGVDGAHLHRHDQHLPAPPGDGR